MAIALDADFRSLKTGPKPESAERAQSAPRRGEAFASQLVRARDADQPEAGTDTPETANISYGGLVVPLHPAEAIETAPPEEEMSLDIEAVLLPDSKGDVAAPDIAASEKPDATAPEPDEVPAPEAALPHASAAPAPPAAESSSDVPAPVISADKIESVPVETGPDIAGTPVTPTATPPVAAAPAPAATADLSTETVAAVAAVTPAMPKETGAAPDKPALAAIPVAQIAKEGPKAADPAELKNIPPTVTETAAPDVASEVPRLLADKPAPADISVATPTATSAGLSLAGPAATPASAPAATPVPMTPTQAVITASPAQLVDIVTQSAEDGQSDRIVVQLDPPELGRVSIDFKFDAAGLQHVTITGETPEAMRQLRQMHFELVQSLERQGLNSQNMTFQHQQQNAQNGPNPGAAGRPVPAGVNAELLVAAALQPGEHPLTPRTMSGGRLDIRL